MLWVFLVFVVVLSGVVAYAADTIARRAGRKHIRWFGLRPKTTALVVAVLSGMAISAASLTAFLLLNKNAVDVIASADQLRPQLDSLRLEIRGAQVALRAANSERDRAQTEAQRLADLQSKAQEELQAARRDLDAARKAGEQLRVQASGLQTRVKRLSTTISTLETRARDNRAELEKSESALKASQNRAQTLDAQVLDFRSRTALAQLDAQNAQDRAADVQARADQAGVRAAQAGAAAKVAQSRAQQAQASARQAQASARQAQAQATAQVQAAQAQVRSTQAQVRSAQAQLSTAQTQVGDLRAQVGQLEDSRREAQQALQAARTAQAAAQTARTEAETQRQAAQKARDAAAAERDKVAAERTRLVAERGRLVAERDRISGQRDKARDDLNALQVQQVQLKKSNEGLSSDLAVARTTLGRLQDEYSSNRAELNASRNTDLAYPKNDLVYAAVVPSVRNLDRFLQDAARAAQTRGARGTPTVRLGTAARGMLETKLRGLNASTFVQCRAAQNAALGFPVDLFCDARSNSVLYQGREIIRRVSVNLKADPRVIQDQISELVRDTVVDITTRGVPDEYIANQGLDVTEFIDLLSRLNARTDATAVVGVAAREDVKPSSRVDLYPVLP